MADQVRTLNAPPADAEEIDEWIGHLDEMVLAHSRAVDAAQRGDQGAVAEASTKLAGALERANESARVLGLDCIFVNQ